MNRGGIYLYFYWRDSRTQLHVCKPSYLDVLKHIDFDKNIEHNLLEYQSRGTSCGDLFEYSLSLTDMRSRKAIFRVALQSIISEGRPTYLRGSGLFFYENKKLVEVPIQDFIGEKVIHDDIKSCLQLMGVRLLEAAQDHQGMPGVAGPGLFAPAPTHTARPKDKKAILEFNKALDNAYPADATDTDYRISMLTWLSKFQGRALTKEERKELSTEKDKLLELLSSDEEGEKFAVNSH